MKLFAIIRKSDDNIERFVIAKNKSEALEDFVFPWKYTGYDVLTRTDATVVDPADRKPIVLTGSKNQKLLKLKKRVLKKQGFMCRVPEWEERDYKRVDYQVVDAPWVADSNGKFKVPSASVGNKWVWNSTDGFHEVPDPELVG